MRIRTAIAASLLSAVAVLGGTAGTATAASSDPHPGQYNDPDVLDLGLNVCGNPIVALLSPASQNACKAN
ncbi:chaplin [Streptomyces sp. PU-14G]|uniref:chaplin n=1 Tax=Streptomyces sp. PU-14G TaxID=2800808 RepID=UPI0034DF0C4A